MILTGQAQTHLQVSRFRVIQTSENNRSLTFKLHNLSNLSVTFKNKDKENSQP